MLVTSNTSFSNFFEKKLVISIDQVSQVNLFQIDATRVFDNFPHLIWLKLHLPLKTRDVSLSKRNTFKMNSIFYISGHLPVPILSLKGWKRQFWRCLARGPPYYWISEGDGQSLHCLHWGWRETHQCQGFFQCGMYETLSFGVTEDAIQFILMDRVSNHYHILCIFKLARVRLLENGVLWWRVFELNHHCVIMHKNAM